MSRALVAQWADPDWWNLHTPSRSSYVATSSPTTRRAATPPPGYAVGHEHSPLPDEVRYGSPVRYSKPPLPDQARCVSPPTSHRSYEPSSPRSSSLTGAVRPQWTERTTAGRAKLAVDANNWQWAERSRQLRNEREDYCGQVRNHVKMKNAYEASAARTERLQALQDVRSQVRFSIENKGLRGKQEVDQMRERQLHQRQQWELYGRQLHAVHNNEGARAQRVAMHLQRGDNCERMRRERERHERARAAEIAQRFDENRDRAERMRTENVRAVQSVSAAELRARQHDVDVMRHAEVRREGYRVNERQEVLATHREYRDAVHGVASRECVAEHNAAERARKAEHAAHVRRQMRRLRHVRMADVLGEAERKRAMHDEIVRERFEGPMPGGHAYAHYPLALRGPSSARGLGYELEGVKRLVGGGLGYSTDEGRPVAQPRRHSCYDDTHVSVASRRSASAERPRRRAASPPARFAPPNDYYSDHDHYGYSGYGEYHDDQHARLRQDSPSSAYEHEPQVEFVRVGRAASPHPPPPYPPPTPPLPSQHTQTRSLSPPPPSPRREPSPRRHQPSRAYHTGQEEPDDRSSHSRVSSPVPFDSRMVWVY